MKSIIEKLKTVKVSTWVRTVLQILVYINQFIALLGNQSFASELWYQWVSFGLTIVITIITYWYNNDWTGFAQIAGDILDMLKDGKITTEEITAFIEKHKKTKEETKTEDSSNK